MKAVYKWLFVKKQRDSAWIFNKANWFAYRYFRYVFCVLIGATGNKGDELSFFSTFLVHACFGVIIESCFDFLIILGFEPGSRSKFTCAMSTTLFLLPFLLTTHFLIDLWFNVEFNESFGVFHFCVEFWIWLDFKLEGMLSAWFDISLALLSDDLAELENGEAIALIVFLAW